MTVRLRLILAFFILILTAFYYLLDFINNNMRPQYLETVEESLNDTAHVLASLVETDSGKNAMTEVMRNVKQRKLQADIYGFTKQKVELQIYTTDKQGIVTYDSSNRLTGQDYSRWNDVYLTLQGKYGARSTRDDPDDPATGALYVAAPILKHNQISGSLTVVKPKTNLNLLIDRATRKIYWGIVLTVISILVFSLLVTLWVTRPIGKLTRYANDLAQGKKDVHKPTSKAPEMRNLLQAFEQMRAELEGKKYIERYIRTLTHELRSPLTGLSAALEILEDDLDMNKRRQFLANARAEYNRLQTLSDHILSLATLENRDAITNSESIVLEKLMQRASALTDAQHKKIQITIPDSRTQIEAIPVLLEQTFTSLFQNALDFSAANSEINCTFEITGVNLQICIQDQGTGIPNYALPHIFEKFYSTERPGGRRSSGLGLAFVKEVIDLHNGSITVQNLKNSTGTIVRILLPIDTSTIKPGAF